MNIDSILNGYVIDHIQAGRAMEIYKFLNLGVAASATCKRYGTICTEVIATILNLEEIACAVATRT